MRQLLFPSPFHGSFILTQKQVTYRWLNRYGQFIRFDATANIRMAAEVLEREWREIGETATGDKTSNTVCIEALRGLELLGSSGRRKVMYGASSTMPREGQKGSVDHVVFRTHSKVWHLCGQRPRISQPAILAFHIKVARHRNYVLAWMEITTSVQVSRSENGSRHSLGTRIIRNVKR